MRFMKYSSIDSSNCTQLTDEWNLIYDLDKKFLVKLFFQVIIICCYAFGLGYSLFYLDNLLMNVGIFLLLLILSYLIMLIPHELVHYICYPNKDNVIIKHNLLKLKFTACIDGTISKQLALISLILPFIIFSIIPSIIIYLSSFNLFLYAIASANAIKSSKDIYNYIFIIKNISKNELLKINEHGIYLRCDA